MKTTDLYLIDTHDMPADDFQNEYSQGSFESMSSLKLLAHATS